MTNLQALNFKIVVRTDPSATQVVFTSSHAVLYIFKEDQWERAEIEGSLLLYSRHTANEPWAFIILNRLHANNYRQLCGEIDSFQKEDDLLMYRTKSGNPVPHQLLIINLQQAPFLVCGSIQRRKRKSSLTGFRKSSPTRQPLPSSKHLEKPPLPEQTPHTPSTSCHNSSEPPTRTACSINSLPTTARSPHHNQLTIKPIILQRGNQIHWAI